MLLENFELNNLSRPHSLERGRHIKYILQLIINKLFPGKFQKSREKDTNFPGFREAKNSQF